MLLAKLVIIAFFSLAASAISYFFAKIKLFSFLLLLFYTCNTILLFLLLSDHHIILFFSLITVFVAIPVVSLLTFAVDVHYALFCTDTSFLLVIVWLLMPFSFIVTFFLYLLISP